MSNEPDWLDVPAVLRNPLSWLLHCLYCGAEWYVVPPDKTSILAHVDVCPRHPLRAAEQRIAELTAELTESKRGNDLIVDDLNHQIAAWKESTRIAGAERDRLQDSYWAVCAERNSLLEETERRTESMRLLAHERDRLRAAIEKILSHESPWDGLVYASELREALEGGKS